MFEKFYPHRMAKNIFELDRSFYISNGIKGVIFDIDNTLVAHDTPCPPEEILEYFDFLRKLGIKYAVVSNNYKERVDAFCRGTGIEYIARAWKPFKKSLRKMQELLSLRADEICLVGDQIFTDIYGGRRMKFYTVLVTAVGENETKFVAFKRIFEKAVLREYFKKHPQSG